MAEPILVSACLLGVACRYDGGAKANARVAEVLAGTDAIPVPVCPEQLAGLPTPRPRTCFAAGDGASVLAGSGSVTNENGEDVTGRFVQGAQQTLLLARLAGCRRAILKERSPSCGSRRIDRNGTWVDGCGVTTALLRHHGIEVRSEEDI